MQLVYGDAYFKKLAQAIPQAKKRVVIAAMVILAGDKMDVILEELKKAAQRGVSVRVLLDNFTRFEGVVRTGDRGQRLRRTLPVLKELSSLGARVYYFGRVGLIPFKGRCHIKTAIVDNDVFAFGGINFVDEMFHNTDYMIHLQDREYADCLEELIKRVGTMDPPLANGAVEISAHNTILFDGGKRHDSIIYDKACELTAQATRVHFVSRMVPSSKLAHLLHETDSTLYYNRPEQLMAPDSWGQAFDQQKYRLTNSYTGKDFLHAKFMLFEMPGGRKALLTGTNNFSYRGVAFGTQELALYSTDKTLWNLLHTFLKQHVQKKS